MEIVIWLCAKCSLTKPRLDLVNHSPSHRCVYRTEHASVCLPCFVCKCDMFRCTVFSHSLTLPLSFSLVSMITGTRLLHCFRCCFLCSNVIIILFWPILMFMAMVSVLMPQHTHHLVAGPIYVAQLYQNFTKTVCAFLLIICNY